MSKKKNSNTLLNLDEKTEIVNDVKAAFNKARKSSNIDYKKKHGFHRSKSFFFITAIIIICLASAGIYWFLANNPKTNFIRSLDVATDNLSNIIVSPKYENSKGTIDISYQLNPEINFQKLNGYSFQIDYNRSTVDNISQGKITINQSDTSSSIDYYKNKKTYLLNTDPTNTNIIFDKYTPFNYDAKNLKALFKELNTSLTGTFEGLKFTNTNTEILVNNKKVDARCAALVINHDNIIEFLDKMYTNLKKNTRFVTSYTKTFGTSKDEFEIEMFNYINDLKLKNRNADSIYINIYTVGVEREFVRFELVANQKQVMDQFSITKISKNKYEFLKDLQTKSEKTSGTFSISKKEKYTKYDLSATKTINNIVTFDGTLKFKVTEESGEKIEKQDVTALNYSELTPEEKSNVDKLLFPLEDILETFKNQIK